MKAGTSVPRITNASMSTASVRPTPNSLMKVTWLVAKDDEHHGDEQRRGGDDPAGALEADGHRQLVVAGAVVLLLDAGQEEHLVVHRQPEGDAEHEDRGGGVDLTRWP